MQQNASAQETPKGRKISSLFPFAVEEAGKKERVQESALVSLGVALWEKSTCVCVPGLYPKDPQRGTLSVSCLPAQTL